MKIYLSIPNACKAYFEMFHALIKGYFYSSVEILYHDSEKELYYDPEKIKRADYVFVFIPTSGIVGKGVFDQLRLNQPHKIFLYFQKDKSIRKYNYCTVKVIGSSTELKNYATVSVHNGCEWLDTTANVPFHNRIDGMKTLMDIPIRERTPTIAEQTKTIVTPKINPLWWLL